MEIRTAKTLLKMVLWAPGWLVLQKEGYVIYRLRCKLVGLFLKARSWKMPAYYEICQFPVYYELIMFYSTGARAVTRLLNEFVASLIIFVFSGRN